MPRLNYIRVNESLFSRVDNPFLCEAVCHHMFAVRYYFGGDYTLYVQS